MTLHLKDYEILELMTLGHSLTTKTELQYFIFTYGLRSLKKGLLLLLFGGRGAWCRGWVGVEGYLGLLGLDCTVILSALHVALVKGVVLSNFEIVMLHGKKLQITISLLGLSFP